MISLPFLETHYPGLRVIVLDRNYGFTGGYNMALQQVQVIIGLRGIAMSY